MQFALINSIMDTYQSIGKSTVTSHILVHFSIQSWTKDVKDSVNFCLDVLNECPTFKMFIPIAFQEKVITLTFFTTHDDSVVKYEMPMGNILTLASNLTDRTS